MDPVSRGIVREVLAADGPLAFDESHPMPGGRAYQELFGIRSQLLMAIRPGAGTAWCVGLHQCSRERRWTQEDRALFRDVALRIKTILDNLLLHRDLKRSRDFHHLVTELQPQLLWTAAADGRMEFVNRRWMEFTGQDWDTSLGDGGLLALHPDDRARCLEAWKRSLETGEPFGIELRYRRADGTYYWHLTRAYPIRGEDGAISRWIGTCTDIDGTKRMQAEADRARAELEVILEGVDEGISAQSHDGKLIYSNRRFAEISGYPSPAALLSASLEERIGRFGLFDESGGPIPWARLPGRRVLGGEDHAQMVMRVVDRVRESERWVIAKSSAVRDPDGKVAMAINFSQDITAARDADAALERSRSQLSAILAGISEAIVAQDPGGRIVYANDAAARLFDLSNAQELMELAARTDPAKVAGMLLLYDESGAPLRIEETPSRKARQGIEIPPKILRFRLGEKGRERWVIARAKPLFDAGGKVSLIIGMTQDITALREREEAVRHLQKMESLGKLAGGIAHDFNNLLVTINGYSELGLAAAEGREGLEEYFREILASGRRAASLIQQLLAYSRKQIIQPRLLRINAVVSDMEKMIRRLIGEDIRVATRLADGIPMVEFDPSQLEQVILNLVVNARDAMPDGGELALETSLARLDAKSLEGHAEARPGTYVSLSVADTGIGMAPEVLERAFEPFFTTKPVGADPSGRTGTGLGLSSVYGMVSQGGGHIAARSEPGAGSVFTVYLPAAETPAGDSPQAPPAAAGQRIGAAGTVLLVEDEHTVRNFARLVLEGWGYRVITAQDGLEALERAKAMPGLHLLLTDVVMPRMRGTALMAEVRKIHPEARVVLMSGYPDQGELSDGCGGEEPRFLQKPFRVEDLAEAIGSRAIPGTRD
jgi:PAS domain S-box-containing protein